MTSITSNEFKKNSLHALHDPHLQEALGKLKKGFVAKRTNAVNKLPEFDQIRDYTSQVKNHTLQFMDYYLEQFAEKVTEQGGHVHWAWDAKEACEITIEISRAANARLITKSKSMVTEEIGLNSALEAAGFNVVETDLGEYIIQVRQEHPSHIVLPAIHVLKEQIAKDFINAHPQLDPDRSLNEPEQLLQEAREVLRDKFLTADVGITGANFLIAENGATAIVTNEGNGDLTQTLPNVHIVIASLEKVIPTVEDMSNVLRLLSRSATGQEITSYVTFSRGPARPLELDGPKQFHVILVDNGRSKMLGSEFQDMLRCIRCGACLNHCPVYAAVGGQAFGSPYPGPMGAVLTPSLFGIENSKDLPNASTFCGRCEQVCPMQIPLPKMMRFYREQEYNRHLSSVTTRVGLNSWAYLAKRPWLYHILTGIVIRCLRILGKRSGRFKNLPLANGWTQFRDFPAPASKTFHQLWRERKK